MYKLYKKPIARAFSNLNIREPRISVFVIFLCKLLARLYLFLFFGVAKTALKDGPVLFDTFKRVLAGKSRCIIAFRHPNGGEPQLLGWFFLFKLRRLAAKYGVKFDRWPHAYFVYGYEVVRWGGWAARFVMPNIGAMPIHHAKMDSQGMARIFKAIVDGPYPLALSPEGQVSYTTDAVPRLEPGAVRMGFHSAQRLEEKSSDIQLEILPVSVYFRFGSWGRFTLELLLKKIEKVCGFSRRAGGKLSFSERLRQCRSHILEVNEDRYQIKADASLSFEERLELVVNTALETAERMLGIKAEGDHFSRMYRVRQLCWDRIFLPDQDSLHDMTPLERSSMDIRAGEAWYIGRHQELVDFCWYFRRPLPGEEAPLHSKIEYTQNLWDFANRSMGGAYPDRVSIFPRKVIIHASPPINLSKRLPLYKIDKKGAVAAAMADLEKAFLECIDQANRDAQD